MADKYTVRDFLVYFITGLFLLVTLLYRFDVSLLEFFKITKTDIKENSALTVFLLIPGLYILGHLVHAVDLLVRACGEWIWYCKISLKRKNRYPLWLKKLLDCILIFFNFLFNGNRIVGVLYAKQRNRKKFWKRVHELRYKGKDNLDYWHLMSDLFKGLTLICIGWTVLYIHEHDIINIIMSATFAVLFWYRAKYMSKTFVAIIYNTRKLQI